MRPIDADELYRETEKKIKANNEYGRAVVDGEFLDLINDAFTEDVVPREELQRIKQETAREIFGELETVMKTRVRRCVNEDGVITPLQDSCWTIEFGDYAQIKKKYTEVGK